VQRHSYWFGRVLNINFPVANPCPCESGKRAVDCCIQNQLADKKPKKIEPPKPATGFANPKCYASSTGDCSVKMSREHYISDDVLRTIDTTGAVKVDGLPWQKDPKGQWISRASMVARVLCKRHNEALSGLDAEAGRLIRTIGRFNTDFHREKPKNDIGFFAGEDIERWMLKTVCAMVASGNARGELSARRVVPNKWVEMLFRPAGVGEPLGLYLDRTGPMHHGRHFIFNQPIIPGENSSPRTCI
jgi:hypothetical protein